MSTKYYCDRCGKEPEGGSGRHLVISKYLLGLGEDAGKVEKDLCGDCLMIFSAVFERIPENQLRTAEKTVKS
jgi:hypothetical protein